MRQNYSNRLRRLGIMAYQPIVTRIELLRATIAWRKGVKAAIAKYKEGGAPRFYMLYDTSHCDFAIMTYEPNRKGLLSYRVLVRMGKWKATRYLRNVEDIKAASFYYTPSKWGAIGCDADNKVREEKLRKWQEYYMMRISVPMKKLRYYKHRIGM